MLECPYCFSIYCPGNCDDKRNPLQLQTLIELVIGDNNATNRSRVNQTEVVVTI
jgi:hypothetical protein